MRLCMCKCGGWLCNVISDITEQNSGKEQSEESSSPPQGCENIRDFHIRECS